MKSLFAINFKKSLTSLLIALPFSLALFIFFPRFEIGFTTFNPKLSKSGFTPDAMPGKQNQLTMSNEVAFRVTFEEEPQMPISQFYWVGNILYQTDGYLWLDEIQPKIENEKFPKVPAEDKIRYEVRSELMTNQYLFVLDAPTEDPVVAEIIDQVRPKSFKLHRIYTKKIKYNAVSRPQSKKDYALSKKERILSSAVPLKNLSKRTKQLAQSLKADSPEQTLSNILEYFEKQGYIYTLRPGTTDNLDQLLFVTKKGFCTHYASAFAILGRIAGLNTRLVTGFQGIKKNDLGNFYSVFQSDAHAWSEVFIPGKGWSRVDPVNVIQPQRIEFGGRDFFELSPTGEKTVSRESLDQYNKRFFTRVSYYWDNVNRQWADFMYSFDQENQYKLARRFNLSLGTFYGIGFAVPVIILVIYFLIYAYRKNLNRERLSNSEIDYRKLIKKMEKFAISKEPSDGPNSMLEKLMKSSIADDKKQKWEKIIKDYRLEKYGC